MSCPKIWRSITILQTTRIEKQFLLSVFVFIDSLVVSLFYKTRVAMRFPVQITSSCIWVAIPAVVRTDGRLLGRAVHEKLKARGDPGVTRLPSPRMRGRTALRFSASSSQNWPRSTPALRTPRYYGHLAITDSSKIPGESYSRLTEINSRYYGLSLLRTYGHLIRSQRDNFIVFSLVIADTLRHRAASWNICTHIKSIFSAF